MVSFPQLGIRLIQLLWTIIITGLVGNVIATATAGNPSSINFAIFVAVFSWLVILFALVGVFIEAFAVPIALLVLDGLATLFTLIAGIVLAAKLGVHSCSNPHYLVSNNLTNGAPNMKHRCQELQASTAFFWFLFASYLISLALTSLSARGSGMSSRRGAPSMSQV